MHLFPTSNKVALLHVYLQLLMNWHNLMAGEASYLFWNHKTQRWPWKWWDLVLLNESRNLSQRGCCCIYWVQLELLLDTRIMLVICLEVSKEIKWSGRTNVHLPNNICNITSSNIWEVKISDFSWLYIPLTPPLPMIYYYLQTQWNGNAPCQQCDLCIQQYLHFVLHSHVQYWIRS